VESINQLNSLSENNSNDIELENEYDSESGMSEVGSCGRTFFLGPDPRKKINQTRACPQLPRAKSFQRRKQKTNI